MGLSQNQKRRLLMIDQPVQGSLLLRVGLYWLLCLFGVVCSSCFWSAFYDPNWTFSAWREQTLARLVPGLAGSFILLPLAWADMLRVSNRFVGPANSLRSAIRRLLSRDEVPRLQTRKRDFWKDIIEQFNRLRKDSSS